MAQPSRTQKEIRDFSHGGLSLNKSILVISDQHFPYHHPDIIAFLRTLNAKYKFDRVVNIGDESDGHAWSYHEKDPNLASPSDELELIKVYLKPLIKLFPEMDILMSNHGSLHLRKGKTAGLPSQIFKNYREILDAPRTWRWHDHLIIRLPDGTDCFFTHGKSPTPTKLSKQISMSTVQGHYHSKFQVTRWMRGSNLAFCMHVGCLIDDSSPAFAYNKQTIERPVIGCGAIIGSEPKLLPMILSSKGRWTGFVP
jgi:hypothetical protein